jgi:Fe-Mn family superoxide dismutase
MLYQLPKLNFRYDELEPYLDTCSLEIHHLYHHQGYVNQLNQVIQNCPNQVTSKPLEEIILDISIVPEEYRQEVRNFGGGHLNHCLFWETIGPTQGIKPSQALENAIMNSFDSLSKLKKQFRECAMKRFGSGWAWLCLNEYGQLEIFSTPNQDSPIMYGCMPILGLDLWEHAYYLKYQHRKEEYIEAWWQVVDWDKVSKLYLERTETVLY